MKPLNSKTTINNITLAKVQQLNKIRKSHQFTKIKIKIKCPEDGITRVKFDVKCVIKHLI